MHRIAWTGSPPPNAVFRHLLASGIDVVERPPLLVTVVSTRRDRLPASPPAGPWIWVVHGPIADRVAIAAARAGAYDAIPLDQPDSRVRLAARIAELAVPVPAIDPGEFVAFSAASRRVVDEIGRAAATSMPVLLTGETGTGKDVAAQLLHARSPRAGHRIVAINCAAIPDHLIEAELFGYARGAFSGAVHEYDGLLTAAAGGTVFLDEIDDTPPTLQVKLLRVLEDRVISRIGESEWHEVDFRIVAATNRDLGALVARGEFAGDLYQRLAIVQIHVPPLRERLDDLPALVERFTHRYYEEEPGVRQHAVRGIAPVALTALAAYPWPGNVRELRNVIYQALVAKRAGDHLLLSDLPRRILDSRAADAGSVVDHRALAHRLDAGTMNLRALLAEVERAALLLALERADGSPSRAARLLGEVGRGRSSDPGATVRAMMQRLGVTGGATDRSSLRSTATPRRAHEWAGPTGKI